MADFFAFVVFYFQDIDSRFGRIWLKFRSNHVATPGAAKKLFISALQTNVMTADVVDVFVVPDYGRFLKPCITKLERAFKNKKGVIGENNYAQLQWTFESVDKSVQFPHGCKLTYR